MQQLRSNVIFNGSFDSTYLSSQLPPNTVTPPTLQVTPNIPLKSHKSGKLTIHLANVTSFSEKVKDWFTKKRYRNAIIALCETKKLEVMPLVNYFKSIGHRAYVNPGTRLTTDSTGVSSGEVISTPIAFGSVPVEPSYLEAVRNITGTALRFAATIVQLQGLTIVIAVMYLSQEGIGVTNFDIFKQVLTLKTLLGIPLLALGDMNLTPTQVAEAGWFDIFKIAPIIPSNLNYSHSLAGARQIDWAFATDHLESLVRSFISTWNNPWSPHFLHSLILNRNVKIVKAWAFKKPKPLPIITQTLQDMPLPRQHAIFIKASRLATKTLVQQRNKTGYAILGRPPPELVSDLKIQCRLPSSILTGEVFAHASLTCEYFYMLVLSIPKKEWPLFIGRGQFPKFYVKSPSFKPREDENNFGFLVQLASSIKSLTVIRNNCENYDTPDRTILTTTHAAKAIIDTIKCIQSTFTADLKVADTPLAEIVDPQEAVLITTSLLADPTKEDLTTVLTLLGRYLDKTENIAHNATTGRWKKHVAQQLAKGGGTLFPYISQTKNMSKSADSTRNASLSYDPNQHLEQEVQKWSKFWSPGTPVDNYIDNTTIGVILKELRQHILDNPSCLPPTFTLQTLDNSLRGYFKDSLGIDFWGPTDLKAIPPFCREPLAAAVDFSLQSVAQPIQTLINLNPLLGKPSGGFRTICKTPILSYRLAVRSFNRVEKWETDVPAVFDQAGKGRSALAAALDRDVFTEVYLTLGYIVAAAFHDFHKFFDTIDIPTIVHKLAEADFPLFDLCFGMQQHVAPRVVQCAGFSSRLIQVNHSILAGCKYSKAFTVGLLHKGITNIVNKHPDVNTSCYVDDTPQITKASNSIKVVENLLDAMLDFFHLAKSLKLSLSPKGVVVSSDLQTNNRLCRALKQAGLEYEAESGAVRDLGVGYAAHRPKAKKDLMKKRKLTAAPVIAKTRAIANINRGGRKLYTASAFSQTTFGHQASGFSDPEILELERQAANCTGINAGRCRYSTLCIAYGPKGHPTVKLYRETFVSWFKYLQGVSTSLYKCQPEDLKEAWDKLVNLAKLGFATSPVAAQNTVNGLMSSIIYLLLTFGWQPTSLLIWTDPQNATWHLEVGKPAPLSVIIDNIMSCFHAQQAVKATLHRNGAGLLTGADWDITLAPLRSTPKKDSDGDKQPLDSMKYHPRRKAALETLMAAATWPLQRVHEAYPHIQPFCKCGQIEDDFHCLWLCYLLTNLEHKEATDIHDTQNLIPQARLEVHQYPCYWLRGIMPKEFTTPEHQFAPTEDHVFQWDPVVQQAPSPSNWPGGTYFGDGSGGFFTKYPTLRRCGVGVAYYLNSVYQYGLSSNLPGKVQTVVRAELYALLIVVQQVVPNGVIDFYIDCKPVFDTFNKGRARAMTSNLADLFVDLFDNIASKDLTLNLHWMPSHLDDPDKLTKLKISVPTWIQPWQIQGNKQADKLADKGAEDAQLVEAATRPVIFRCLQLTQIQKRISAVALAFKPRPRHKSTPAPAAPLPSIDALCLASPHSIVKLSGKKLMCSKCKSKITPSTDKATITHFLNSPCHTHQRKLTQILIGSQHSHHTHRITFYGGLAMCSSCGAIGHDKLHLLARQCNGKPPPLSDGEKNINAKKIGKKPPGYRYKWPTEPNHILYDPTDFPEIAHTAEDRFDRNTLNTITRQVTRLTHLQSLLEPLQDSDPSDAEPPSHRSSSPTGSSSSD